MDLIERLEQRGLQLWHSDLSVQPTNQRWMSRGLLLPFRTGNAELLFLCQSGLNWTGLLLAVLLSGLFPVRIIYCIIIFQMFYFEKRPGSHPVLAYCHMMNKIIIHHKLDWGVRDNYSAVVSSSMKASSICWSKNESDLKEAMGRKGVKPSQQQKKNRQNCPKRGCSSSRKSI